MKSDVLGWSAGNNKGKIVSKETLNHRGLVELASGLDVYEDTRAAYLEAYRSLGIDLVNRVPLENASPPTPAGERREHPTHPDYVLLPLGVFDTAFRHRYPCTTLEDVWDEEKPNIATMEYEDLIVPVPHPCRGRDIRKREDALGEIGLYYPMLYTTLFLWGVETFGWELFMLAAMTDPVSFYERFLVPCAEKSKRIVEELVRESRSPFLFVHDDPADRRGPVFRPKWYDENIFPLYRTILEPAFSAGKDVIFVADGNMTEFLPRLRELGIRGIMFENPATPLEAVVEYFGDGFMIGGIDTARLTFGRPDEIRRMVFEVLDEMSGYPGFAISSCGGLHGNIPLENLVAYFDARAEAGIGPCDWKKERPSSRHEPVFNPS